MQLPATILEQNVLFYEIIKELNFEPEAKKILQHSDILKVKVNRKKGSWHVYLKLDKVLLIEHFNEIAARIRQMVPGLNDLIFIPKFAPGCLTLDDFCTSYWDLLVVLINEKTPAIENCLNLAEWKAEGNRLLLSLPSLLQVEYLEQKKCGHLLQEILHDLLGYPCAVEFTLHADPDEPMYAIEDLERNYLDGLTSSEPKDMRQNGPATDEVLLGKRITTAPAPIKDIIEEEKAVVIKGVVSNLEVRELKSGRTLVTFDLADQSSAITVKFFEQDKEKERAGGKAISNQQCLMVRGAVQQDRFTQELTVLAYDINKAHPDLRRDLAEEKRVELHLHTKMSALDGMTDIQAVVKRAAEWGHPAIAVTDHGVVQAFPEAYEAGKKHNIKIIYGVEGYLINDPAVTEKSSTFHIVILVQNQQGLENLYRLITASHLQYFYRKPRLPKQELNRMRQGLILGTACEAGELIQAILQHKDWEELKEIARFYDYLEIQPLGNNEFMIRNGIVDSEADLININKLIIKLGEELEKPVIATGDVHFLEPEDEVYRRVLMCGQGFADESQAPLFFRTTEEMLNEFSYLPAEIAKKVVINNPQALAKSIDQVLPIPEELYAPEIPGAEEQIASMSKAKAVEIYGAELPRVVRDRLDKELNSIISNGFAVLYLIAQKLVKKSNDDGYLVGSRGSVGSSFVATLTGITEVNPLPPHYICPNCKNSEFIEDGSFNCGIDMPDKECPRCGAKFKKDGHDIPFETFLGFKGDKVPDIDLNFSGNYQPRAHKYTEELFGKDYVFRAGTIATIADRTAFGFVKNFFEERNIKPRNAEIARLVSGCTGVKRTTGQHPGGLMVVPKYTDIHKFTPLQRPADDMSSATITTHFDYHSISSRLVKLDILGHDDPTVIKMLEDLTGTDAKNIPLDDAKTMSLFSTVETLGLKPEDINSTVGTLGIPEFGTRFVRQMLEDTSPQTFSDLVRISGFSHGTDVWLNNAQDLIKKGIAKLSEAISTRDDIMIHLIYKGLEPITAFKIMEDVRKGKGVKPEYEEVMLKQNVPHWYIESCKKIKYMFPKAHAVAYVTMAFRIAFYKVYYPEAFYASFFTVRADEFDADLITKGPKVIKQSMQLIEQKGNEASAKEKNLLAILEIALEMYQRGIKMRKVNLWESASASFQVVNGELLPPFSSLQGVGASAAVSIVEARNERLFTSVEDLRIRARLSKTIIDILREHGCLQGLTETDQLSIF